ncbi:MAG: NUDIX domain-containing protein [Terricaulis sp.]
MNSAQMNDWRIKLEPFITPAFRTWWRMRRAMTLGVRGLALDSAGRVLLVRHTYAPGWHLPGGGVESGETAIEAIVREMAEEGGVAAEGAPTLLGFYANHANFPNDHIALYRFENWRACAPQNNGEIAVRGFFALDALPEGVTLGTQRRLAEIFEGAAISDAW